MFKVSDTINYEAGRALNTLMKEVDDVVLTILNSSYKRNFYNSLYNYLIVEKNDIKHYNSSILLIGDQHLKVFDLFKEKVNQKDKIGIEELKNPLIKLALLTSMSDSSLNETNLGILTVKDMTIAEIENLALTYSLLNSYKYYSRILTAEVHRKKVKWLLFYSGGLEAMGKDISDFGREVLLADSSIDFIIGYRDGLVYDEYLEEIIECTLMSLSQDDIHKLGRTNPMFDVSVLANELGAMRNFHDERLFGFQADDLHEVVDKVVDALNEVLK